MGLIQRRIILEYQDSVFRGWKKQFDEVCGCEIPMEVLWDTMQSSDRDRKEQYFQSYDEHYFRPLMQAFSELCSDTMGKDAVKAGVKKIVIGGSEGAASFTDGVFTVQHPFYVYQDDRAERWKKMIAAQL